MVNAARQMGVGLPPSQSLAGLSGFAKQNKVALCSKKKAVLCKPAHVRRSVLYSNDYYAAQTFLLLQLSYKAVFTLAKIE